MGAEDAKILGAHDVGGGSHNEVGVGDPGVGPQQLSFCEPSPSGDMINSVTGTDCMGCRALRKTVEDWIRS